MSDRPTVKAEPPLNLIYDMKAAARLERREVRAEMWHAAGRVYVVVGATAGLAALVLSLVR